MPRSYTTSRRESARPPMEPDGFAADYGGSSTVSKVVQEVAAKIERMKKELQERKERAKQLQGELMRVESAKERREKKIVEKWELQLRKLDDEHRKTYDEMQSFRDRLAQDIKKLEAQSHELKGKLSKMAQDHEQQLHFARQENLKKLDKAKKQWRQDEKGFMEKVLNSRMEQLKKQAVDSLTPELDNLVRTNKEALEALRVEHENQLRKLTMTLEHEVERKIEAYRQSLQDEVRDESEKAQEVTRKRLDTARRALEQEHEQMKGKFESDKQHLTEEYERLIAQEDALHQQSMTALQEKQATMVQELLTQQQKAVSDLLTQQSQEMASIQSRLKDEVTSFQESLLKLQSQQAETRFKYLQQQLFADVAKETDEIHRKLREDAEHHRKEMIARYEQDLQSLRQSMSSNVESLQEQETKAHLRLTQLRSEVEQLKAQLDAKRQANPALLHMINQELKPKLQTLRQDLRQAEDDFYEQEGQLQRTQEQVQDDKAQQLHEMQRRVEELHQREEDQVRQLAQRRSQSETDFAVSSSAENCRRGWHMLMARGCGDYRWTCSVFKAKLRQCWLGGVRWWWICGRS